MLIYGFFCGLRTARRHSVGTEIERRLAVEASAKGRVWFVPRHSLVGVADDYDGSIGYFHGLRLV